MKTKFKKTKIRSPSFPWTNGFLEIYSHEIMFKILKEALEVNTNVR